MRYHLNIRRGEGSGASRWQRFASPVPRRTLWRGRWKNWISGSFCRMKPARKRSASLGDCACLEKKCGACAMVVSGRPALACAVSLGAAADSSGRSR